MKNLYQYTMILLAGVLGACSSLEVSDPYSENLPSDFSVATYMDVHPYLRKFQYKDYVEARNAFVKDSLSKVEGANYNTLKTEDEANFKAMDPNVLAAICKDPYMGGYPEASCVNVAANADIMKDLLEFNLVGVADDFAMLSSFPVDSVAISQQYVVFGRSHGWAYRWCESEADLAGPGRDPAIVAAQSTRADDPSTFMVDPGIYCAERGTKVLHKVN